MASYFFRVEHDLLRSEIFKTLGGSAIKVYLVIGLYSDFGTDWAYPSIRTIAHQAGLSRQTVISAIAELTEAGLLAASRSKGRSTAYRILRDPGRSQRTNQKGALNPENRSRKLPATGLESLEDTLTSGLESLVDPKRTGQKDFDALDHFLDGTGQPPRPNQEPNSREQDTTSVPIPGTPFRLTAEGRVLVAVDLQELLTNQGIPRQLAGRIVAQKDPEAVAKVLLNAFYLQSQGKLQNGPGYIRAGIEDGYELLPQVANRLEDRRRALETELQKIHARQVEDERSAQQAAEEAAIVYVLNQLGPAEVNRLVAQAIKLLPEPLVRHNRTLSNPFIRGKVYELASGDPVR